MNFTFLIFNSRKASGFTLFELMVVIFIVSLVFAVALPSFTGIGESRLKSDAKRLGSIIRYLNDSAISTKEILQMKVVFSDRVISYTGPDGERSERFDSLSGIELQSRGMVSDGEVIIFFSPIGGTENFAVRLIDKGPAITVSFNSASGKVKIMTSNK